MSKKHRGGPAPVPPGNRPRSGPEHRVEEKEDQEPLPEGASTQEQDPQKRLGGYETAGEHSIQQPSKLNDGE